MLEPKRPSHPEPIPPKIIEKAEEAKDRYVATVEHHLKTGEISPEEIRRLHREANKALSDYIEMVNSQEHLDRADSIIDDMARTLKSYSGAKNETRN